MNKVYGVKFNNIDNVMYDKSDETLNLSVINIYEVKYDNEIR